MFTKSDIATLRANGTTDREILSMTARILPSASKALRDIDADKTTPDMQKNKIMRQMIDKNAKSSGPSMIPYVSALTVNTATKKSDALDSAYKAQEQSTKQQNPFSPFAKGETTLAQRLQGALPKEGSMMDYATAPGAAAAGGIIKGIGAMTGMDVSSNKDVQQLPSNLKQSASVARVAIPVAAGIATGGASLPISAAISGAAGAGSSLLASGLESAAGEDQTMKGAIGEAVATGVTNAAIDAATMGLLRLAKPLLKAKGAADLTSNLKGVDGGVVGKVVQSKKAVDIEKAARALNDIPIEGIKTYDDLSVAINNRLTSLRTAQDEVLGAVQDVKPLSSFGKTIGQGKNAVKVNPVSSALDGLEELYAKSGAADDLVRIRDLKSVAKKGLTPKQVNDIAREYGKGYGAFSDATGQPLTSVNAKFYENTRKGVKEAARNLMPNDATKLMDDKMSDLIPTGKLAKKMSEAVRGLSSKLEQRGIFSRVASKVGGGVDLALGRTPSSIFTSLFLRGNVGAKQLNSSQIQALLPKNLKLIQELTEQIDTLPEGAVVGKLKEIFGGIAQKTASVASQAGVGAISNTIND